MPPKLTADQILFARIIEASSFSPFNGLLILLYILTRLTFQIYAYADLHEENSQSPLRQLYVCLSIIRDLEEIRA